MGTAKSRELLCPSSRGGERSVLIGIVTASEQGPRVLPTERTPVTAEILKLAEPVSPTEVFRFASPCQSGQCPHFRNQACQLAVRSVDLLPPVVDELPKCSIRPQCRWFQQEGAAICKRCPQIVTDQFNPSETQIQIVYGSAAPLPEAAAGELLMDSSMG